MTTFKDQAPVPQTCPMIDDVIQFLEYVSEMEDKAEIDAQSKVFIDVMEQIRSANEALRRWGNEKVKEVNQLTKESAGEVYDCVISASVDNFVNNPNFSRI